jgi:hypothetical protein
MKVSRAYCKQTDSVVDIYEARKQYFSQKEDIRDKLDFICSDIKCRELDEQPKISGVNYRVYFSLEDKFKAPHFRNVSKNIHHEQCGWKVDDDVRKSIEKAIALGQVDEAELPNRFKSIVKAKDHDVIDLFCLDDLSVKESIVEVAVEVSNDSVPFIRDVIHSPRGEGSRKKTLQLASLNSGVLHELVTCFNELTYEERKILPLQIGKDGSKRSYAECFLPMKKMPQKSYTTDLVFYGGCVAKRYGTYENPKGFLLKFYDKVKLESGDKGIEFYLNVEELRLLPYGELYINAINTAAEYEEYYLRVFMFLPSINRYEEVEGRHWKIDVLVPNYQHIDVILIKKNKND